MHGTISDELLAHTRAELAEVERVIRGHRFLEDLEGGRAPRAALEALAGEQRLIARPTGAASPGSPRASPRRLPERSSSRWPRARASRSACWATSPPPRRGRGAARRPRADPRVSGHPSFVAWLALNGSRSDVGLAFLANLAALASTTDSARSSKSAGGEAKKLGLRAGEHPSARRAARRACWGPGVSPPLSGAGTPILRRHAGRPPALPGDRTASARPWRCASATGSTSARRRSSAASFPIRLPAGPPGSLAPAFLRCRGSGPDGFQNTVRGGWTRISRLSGTDAEHIRPHRAARALAPPVGAAPAPCRHKHAQAPPPGARSCQGGEPVDWREACVFDHLRRLQDLLADAATGPPGRPSSARRSPSSARNRFN